MKTIATIVIVLLASMIAPGQDKHWLDTQTKVELSLSAGAIAADAWTTRKYVGQRASTGYYTYEANPLAQPFAKSDAGEATMSGVCFTGLVLGNYLLRGHPRVRHVMNWATIGVEGYLAVHNSQLRTR